MPPNEQHERVNLILMASALLLLFNVMVFLFYLSTLINNGKIMLQKSWRTEKWVTKGKNFIRYGIHVPVVWKNYSRQEKALRKHSFPLRRTELLNTYLITVFRTTVRLSGIIVAWHIFFSLLEHIFSILS